MAYTVQYKDADGNELAESQTFYGNVGDKPVVAYRYIENYVPQALALTKTLSENAAENVFTFTYAPGETNRVIETTTTITTVVPGNTVYNTVTVPAGTSRWNNDRWHQCGRWKCKWNNDRWYELTDGNANDTTTPGGRYRCEWWSGCRSGQYNREVRMKQTPQGSGRSG